MSTRLTVMMEVGTGLEGIPGEAWSGSASAQTSGAQAESPDAFKTKNHLPEPIGSQMDPFSYLKDRLTLAR